MSALLQPPHAPPAARPAECRARAPRACCTAASPPRRAVQPQAQAALLSAPPSRRRSALRAARPVVAIVAPSIERGEQATDLMQHLLQNRIIFVGRPINDTSAQQIVSAMMALELADSRADIKLYMNAQGGQQYSVMAVIDMMRAVKCDVQTVALGSVSGNAVLVLASGAKGKRLAMRNTRIIVNQPLGGVQGSYIDVKLQAAEQNRNLKIAQVLLSQTSGMSMDEAAEMLDRDTFLSAEQAVAAGIVDAVV